MQGGDHDLADLARLARSPGVVEHIHQHVLRLNVIVCVLGTLQGDLAHFLRAVHIRDAHAEGPLAGGPAFGL
jgi:hypothetical protein